MKDLRKRLPDLHRSCYCRKPQKVICRASDNSLFVKQMRDFPYVGLESFQITKFIVEHSNYEIRTKRIVISVISLLIFAIISNVINASVTQILQNPVSRSI